MTAPLLSMTGFGSAEGLIGENRYRIEVKALNHRFLDLKVRLPREFSSAELALRAAVQAKFARGALDVKIDRATEGATAPQVSVNLELARAYAEKLREMARALKISEEIGIEEIARFPDVLSRSTSETAGEEAWSQLKPLVETALRGLAEMRKTEGDHLKKVLLDGIEELERGGKALREKRVAVSAKYPDRIREKVKIVFEAHPLAETSVQAVMETRIAQELALLADRTDIEEELTRFAGHLEHFRKIIKEGGAAGRKLDFVLQELNREINTLGNKAQDFHMSEDVVQMKVKLEQLREQVMNIE